MQNYKVTVHRLSVRKSPSLSGEIIGYLRKGDVVTFLDISEDEYWFRIETPSGLTGWSSHRCLVSADEEERFDADRRWLNLVIRENFSANPLFSESV